ncbi:phosphoesterase, partial [Candidatus Bathyarchaeota archaeon]|nr:phosphoesterase [Candidatus Bathyarchaeota archaeon]
MITPLIPHPAALIRSDKTKTLVISDLHIGWEIALSDSGIHVPTQTYRLLKHLKALVTHHKPEELLILGD